MQKLSSIEDAECSQPASSLPAPMFLPLGSPLPTIYDALTNQDGKERNKEPSALPILHQERRQDMNHKKEGRMLTYLSKPSRFLPSLPSRLTFHPVSLHPSPAPRVPLPVSQIHQNSSPPASRFHGTRPSVYVRRTLGVWSRAGTRSKKLLQIRDHGWAHHGFGWSDFPLSLPFIRPLDSILSHTQMLT